MVHSISGVDLLTLGRRIRHYRKAAGLTLAQLSEKVGRAPSALSGIENGRREARLSTLESTARALGVSLSDLLSPELPGERDRLEVAVERLSRGPLFTSLGLGRLGRLGPLPDSALTAIVTLAGEIERLHAERASSTDEARAANTRLREQMRRRGNYFAGLELRATELRAAIGLPDGPLLHDSALDLARHLGFAVRPVDDLPFSTRSVTDTRARVIYVPAGHPGGPFSRSILLQALAADLLAFSPPADYAAFLRQRVESNYLSAALMIPEGGAVKRLRRGHQERRLSIGHLMDTYRVGPEVAVHRFTNLSTKHLGLRVHFAKIHRSGAISKAYGNDALVFPTDVFGNIEGQQACARWVGRRIFAADGEANRPLSQYLDTPQGSFWEMAWPQVTEDGPFSLTLGVPFDEAGRFVGRETTERQVSRCPEGPCCRPGPDAPWVSHVRAAPKPHASVLAALPAGPFPGISQGDLAEFVRVRSAGEG